MSTVLFSIYLPLKNVLMEPNCKYYSFNDIVTIFYRLNLIFLITIDYVDNNTNRQPVNLKRKRTGYWVLITPTPMIVVPLHYTGTYIAICFDFKFKGNDCI